MEANAKLVAQRYRGCWKRMLLERPHLRFDGGPCGAGREDIPCPCRLLLPLLPCAVLWTPARAADLPACSRRLIAVRLRCAFQPAQAFT